MQRLMGRCKDKAEDNRLQPQNVTSSPPSPRNSFSPEATRAEKVASNGSSSVSVDSVDETSTSTAKCTSPTEHRHNSSGVNLIRRISRSVSVAGSNLLDSTKISKSNNNSNHPNYGRASSTLDSNSPPISPLTHDDFTGAFDAVNDKNNNNISSTSRINAQEGNSHTQTQNSKKDCTVMQKLMGRCKDKETAQSIQVPLPTTTSRDRDALPSCATSALLRLGVHVGAKDTAKVTK